MDAEHFSGQLPNEESAEMPPMPTFYELSGPFDWAGGVEAPDMRLQGDFYRETEDVTRGVTLPFPIPESDPFRSFGVGEEFNPLLGKAELGKLGPVESPTCDSADASFNDSVQPPVAPFSGKHMPPTSLLLKAESPAAIAQSLHELLRAEPGEILKVSTPKFAVKADVVQEVNGNLLHCRVKARVYRCAELEESDTLIVDFCRRAGDCVAFQRTFARATQHLLAKFAAASKQTEAPSCAFDDAPPLPLDAMDTSDVMLVPLLDMLQGDVSAEQTQQAEAVAALATVARASTASAVAVCAALNQLSQSQPGVLEACVTSCRAEVSYPAARLDATMRECGYTATN